MPVLDTKTFVPVQTRSERPTSFDPADFGVPTGREVNWRLSDLKRLAPLLADEAGTEGVVTVDVADIEAAGYIVASAGHEVAPRGEIFRPEDLPSAIAWKQTPNALHICIPKDERVAQPLIARLSGTDATGIAHAHIVLEAEEGSEATIVLAHSGSAAFSQNVEIIVRDNAKLTVVSLQQWDDDTVHAASHQAVVGESAYLRHFVVTFGGAVVRVNPSLRLEGNAAEGEMFGLSFADAGQHLESQVYLHHDGTNTRGDVLYKTALQGAKARTVWVGDVLIGPNAVGTDSYEKNQNLVLTDGARADSIPNLEIETGDIAGAGHASTTGRFDDEHLFYLQARGITEAEARRLVVYGFLSDIVQRIGIPELEESLLAEIERELAEVNV